MLCRDYSYWGLQDTAAGSLQTLAADLPPCMHFPAWLSLGARMHSLESVSEAGGSVTQHYPSSQPGSDITIINTSDKQAASTSIDQGRRGQQSVDLLWPGPESVSGNYPWSYL